MKKDINLKGSNHEKYQLTDPYAVPHVSMHRNKHVATPCIFTCPTLTVVRCKIAAKEIKEKKIVKLLQTSNDKFIDHIIDLLISYLFIE